MCAAHPPTSPAPRAKALERLAEAMLADVLAFNSAGYDLLSLRISVNRTGGTVKAGKLVLHSPVDGHLSHREIGRALDAFERLLEGHGQGTLPAELLERIRAEHGVRNKAEKLKRQTARLR